MDLPAGLDVLHQPQRLRLMALLYRQRDLSFAATRDALGLTDGNLSSHAKRLQDSGLLENRRVLAGDHFEVRYRITAAGSQAFGAYLAWLRAFLSKHEP